MPIFPEYESFDGIGLGQLVKRGVMSASELLEVAIERIANRNPALNAVIYNMVDQARSTLAHPIPSGPFQGVPFLLKDLLADCAGVPLSSGSRFMREWIPEADSELVQRFKRSGLIMLGKTNTPEFGLSSVTEPVCFGPTRNPWNVDYSPGGSSGGSAAAVSARMVPMAHANDGAGSIRIPAAFCGLFGLKPSRGRTVSGSGLLRIWDTLVVEHVLTRSVRDSAAMLDVLSLSLPEQSFLSCLDNSFVKRRIAVIEAPFFASTVDPDYVKHLHQAAKLCENLGHTVELATLQVPSEDVALAFIIVVAGEIAASIKRISEIMGRKPKAGDLEKQTRLLCRIGVNTSAADFAWAGDVLGNASRQLSQFFQQYDMLMTPTMPGPPPKIGELKPDFVEQNLLKLLTHVSYAPVLRKAMEHAAVRNFALYPYTPLFNISGQPAMSVPLYTDKNGLPVGIQFAGRVGEEATLLQLARQLEIAHPWIEKSPA